MAERVVIAGSLQQSQSWKFEVGHFVRERRPNSMPGHLTELVMEKFHRGRLVDHIHLRVADLARGQRSYRAVFGALGKSELLR